MFLEKDQINKMTRKAQIGMFDWVSNVVLNKFP